MIRKPCPVPGALAAVSASLCLGLAACGGGPSAPPPVAVRQTPQDAILRLATVWEARQVEKGLRSSPSRVAAFERQVVSRIVLSRSEPEGTETLTVGERLTLRDGSPVQCSGQVQLPISVAYGRKEGEPVVELAWQALAQALACDRAATGLPPFERPAGRSRFALRSDQLVAIEPPLEKRVFLPVE